MALSYDPATKSTVGFLSTTAGRMTEIVPMLDQVSTYAAEPFLVPILMYWVSASMLRRQMRDISQIMEQIQQDTGLLDRFFQLENTPDPASAGSEQPHYDDLHQKLVEQHARLTIGLSDFLLELGKGCREGLHIARTLRQEWGIPGDDGLNMDLLQYLEHLENGTKSELQRRERFLSRVDMQLKVVCSTTDSPIVCYH
jgi:hypothetical protein